ncbi:5'-nucleotidase [Paramagnetospirillum magnetotacticum MS-1]|uniref:5'-nucleotidase n=1 Tax=Paramagnetospirillum magnetotacticum MS-1 TaxID=272627 RepID=A0A0C2YPZ6_PARME|nr:5'-nucleotidase [Paramagnetospirillum magnetotacticum]KIL96730.1 5'-nucleotidase [Paramagnetospirillum magnetotacticum MS-1]
MYQLADKLVIGISSRALFCLEAENRVFDEEGVRAYRQYQAERDDVILEPGTAFGLVRNLLRINEGLEAPLVEVVVVSRNSPDVAIRVFRSIEHHRLAIKRAAFTSGHRLPSLLKAFNVQLFLSRHAPDVSLAVSDGIAAARLYDPPDGPMPDIDEIHFAFDGDAVLFSEASEIIYQREGLAAFAEHERLNAHVPLAPGPFAPFLRTLALLQSRENDLPVRIRTSLVTARCSPAHERVLRTFRDWGVTVDQALFLGGVDKASVLEAIRPDIFFDDQEAHLTAAATIVPSGQVPWPAGSR